MFPFLTNMPFGSYAASTRPLLSSLLLIRRATPIRQRWHILLSVMPALKRLMPFSDLSRPLDSNSQLIYLNSTCFLFLLWLSFVHLIQAIFDLRILYYCVLSMYKTSLR